MKFNPARALIKHLAGGESWELNPENESSCSSGRSIQEVEAPASVAATVIEHSLGNENVSLASLEALSTRLRVEREGLLHHMLQSIGATYSPDAKDVSADVVGTISWNDDPQ